MFKERKILRGFTLVEVIVTLAMGAIFFTFVGILIAYSFESWFKSQDVREMETDARTVQRKMEFEFRNATTHPVTIQDSNGDGVSDTLQFATYDTATDRYTKHKYQITGGQLKSGEALVPAGGNPNAVNPAATQVEISNVRDAESAFRDASAPGTNARGVGNATRGPVEITISQQRTSRTAGGKTSIRKKSFEIQRRNRKEYWEP